MNNFHPSIKFTVESPNSERKLNFLDRTYSTNIEGTVKHEHYIKPMQSNRTVHFSSHQPASVKIATVKGELSRAVKRSQDYEEKSTQIIRIKHKYQENGYPSALLDSLCDKHLSPCENLNANSGPQQPNLSDANHKGQQTSLTLPSTTTHAAINPQKSTQISRNPLPYVRGLHEPVCRLLKSFNIYTYAPSQKSLQQMWRPPTPKNVCMNTDLFQSNVVYAIPCLQCDKFYVGTTGLTLAERISRHSYEVKKKVIFKLYFKTRSRVLT